MNWRDRPGKFVHIVIAFIPKNVSGTIMDGSSFDLMDAASSNDTMTRMIQRERVKLRLSPISLWV